MSDISTGRPENSYRIQTFGCKVNTYDTGLLQKRLAEAGYYRGSKDSRIHILNTCAVTQEATKEALRTIRRLKARDPFCTVVVTGCGAQVDTIHYQNFPGADLVIANSHKGELESLIKKHLRGELEERVFKSNIFKKEDLEMGGGTEEEHTRAFLKIQDGCNSFCTYCVIPFARGKSRSVPKNELVKRVQQLYDQGVREVVLTGVHIGDYEGEILANGKASGLEDLLESLLKQTRIPRFRLSSLEPHEVTERLLDLYSDDRLCPHFHMSIQSADSSVLADMKRHYTSVEVENSLQRIESRIAGAFVGMDVIVGFPTETAETFKSTFDRLNGLPWTRIHVFPYSERPGTKAALLSSKVPPFELSKRSAQLRELSSDRYAETALKQVQTVKKVLILKKPANGCEGLSRDYWPIQVEVPPALRGCEVDVEILGFDQSHENRMTGGLVGRWIEGSNRA